VKEFYSKHVAERVAPYVEFAATFPVHTIVAALAYIGSVVIAFAF
jgi:hypothetical protein